MSRFRVTKTFGNELGFSCCFRQWKAVHSHCHKLHGYSLGVRFIISNETLDEKEWVYDFGGFKPVKELLTHFFDHTLLIAADDPELETFQEISSQGIADLRIMENGVGCERFAEFIYHRAKNIIERDSSTVEIESVEVFEHGANSATYQAIC